jgi:UPF0755 protein
MSEPFDQDDPVPADRRPRGARATAAPPERRPGGRADDPVDDEYADDEYADGDYADDDYDDEYVDDEYDDEYVELRPQRSGGRKVLLVLLGLIVILALLAGSALLWVQRRIDPPGPPGETVAIEVPNGSTTEDIGSLLEDEDVIASATVWKYYVQWKGAGPFQAGAYEFRENSHLDDVIEVLDGGPAAPEARRFTMPEGYTVGQTLDRLADEERGLGLDRAVLEELLASGEIRSQYQPPEQPSSEGILFPETYEVPDEIDERGVLELMVGQLDRTMAELGVESAQERFNLTPYEVLIVASLIERETRVDSERPMVARVIYNRLSQGIALGIDATSCYEKGEQPCVLTTSDLESDSPYNTRFRLGLVPTPIASPGRASIEAALNPADGSWIYYVLQDADGTHFFTDSASEFEQKKIECREKGLGCG